MNKLLALHFEEAFLIAGTEPFPGRFTKLISSGSEKFWFYFFIDRINNRIDYGEAYKTDFYNQKADIIGNFFTELAISGKTFDFASYKTDYIELLFPITEDIRNAYRNVMEKSGNSLPVDEPIPVAISFSDNIPKVAQNAVVGYLRKRNFEIVAKPESTALLWADIKAHNLFAEKPTGSVAIIDTFGNNMNISLIQNQANSSTIRSHYKQFADYGIDPGVQIIASKLVSEINKQLGLLNNETDIKNEINRHYSIAEKLLWKINTENRPYLTVRSSFAISEAIEVPVTISVDEITRLTAVHLRQMSRFYEDSFLKAFDLSNSLPDQLILLGDSLDSPSAKKEFARFGADRLRTVKSAELYLCLVALLKKAEHSPKNNTENSSNVEKFVPASAKPGVVVTLFNFDAQTGKGHSMQKMKYLGNNQFEIIESTRSLQAGDVATPTSEVWLPGRPVEFTVSRKGKKLGRFVTRPVKSILVISNS